MVVVLCCLGVFLRVFLLLFFLNIFIRRSLISWWQKQENNNTFSKEKKPLLCQHFCADVGGRICKHTPLLTFNTIWQREARALESPLPLVKTLKYAGNAKVCKKFALCIFTAHYWEKTNKKNQLNLSLQRSYSLPFVRHLPCC